MANTVSLYEKVADNIYEMSDRVRGKKRNLPFRVQIHYQGRQYVKMFPTKEEAKIWRDDKWRLLRMPKEHRQIAEMQATSVSSMCLDYRARISLKKGRESEAGIIFRFAQHPLANKSIYDFDRRDADNYLETKVGAAYDRRGWKAPKPLSPAAVDREKTILRRIWTVAERTHEKLHNPWKGRVEGYVPIPRGRTLEKGELEALIKGCKKCHGLNKVYVPLAIFLATDTAMRQQEIFNLTWRDINFDDRTINIAKSKTDKENAKRGLPPGRTIVLPFRAMIRLCDLAYERTGQFCPNTNERVFPLTADGHDPKFAFRQSWTDLRKRAGIKPFKGEMLEFKDLRRYANSCFNEAGLTGDEEKIMLGHAFREMTEVYRDYKVRARRLTSIREKLDRFVLNGKTLEEMLAGLEGLPRETRMMGLVFSQRKVRPEGTLIKPPDGMWSSPLE